MYIDRSRRRIGRRGWLWGYRFEMNFEDIKEVVIAQENRASVIYVKDEFHHCYFMGFKQSYISIQYSEKNMAFIRRAWGGPIKEKRDDFFYIWKN